MNRHNPYSLIDAADSVLIAIDVQHAFLRKLPPPDAARLLNNVCWLVKVAMWRDIPLVVTAEGLDDQPVAPQLVETLPPGTLIFNKVIFGLADQADILAAVQRAGRKTAVLVGLETDVCVMHSALGLLERGYRVAVVADATGSPAPNHEIGLGRMRSAGILIVNMKGLFYEWLSTLEAVERFHRELPDMRHQAGIVL